MNVNYIHEKGIKEVNEDSFLIKEKLFGVFDGATSLKGFIDAEGRTGGQIASSIAKATFSQQDNPLKELALEANENIREAMVKAGIDISDKLNLWCTNLAVVKIEENAVKWLQLSDAGILFIYSDDSFKVFSSDHDLPTLLKWRELADKKTENIRSMLKEQVDAVRRDLNVTYGFLTGEKEVSKFFKEGEESIQEISHILIFSDGLTIPSKDPSQPAKWDILVNLYLQGGLKKVRDYIRNIEENDPKCWEYPRLKKHDDMTAISIALEN